MIRALLTNCLCCFVLINATCTIANELVTGSVVGRNIFALAYDVNGDPLMIDDAPLIFAADAFDVKLSALAAASDNGKSFIVSGFGDVIGGLYLSKFDDDTKRFIDTRSFELSAVGGLSRPRGGVTTSWGSVLFSEAGLVDATDSAAFIDAFKSYYKGKADMVKPYNYGWVSEAILLDDKGAAKLIKNYSVGRLFASHLYLMPDGKSLYLFDAEHAGQLYFYVAKEAHSLTDGTLYGVSLKDQKADYVPLGSISALKMKFKLKKIGFDKLFDTSVLKDGRCTSGFSHIVTLYGEECLKPKNKNKKYTGLFEPIRALAIRRKTHTQAGLSDIAFDRDFSRIELTREGGSRIKFSLGQNEKLNSRYVIEEVQR